MASKREQLEKLVHDTQAFADEIDGRGTQTAEETTKLTAMLTDIKTLSEAVKAEAEVKGTMDDAKSFLASLAGPAIPEQAKSTERETYTLGGLPMETQGKTFGELFVSSPAYADFKGRYAGRDGVIPASVKGIQSAPFQSDLKALITGASATSAGAAVRNDLYGPITDLVGERELSVRDIVTIGQTDSDTVEYVRVTSKTNAAAPTAEATTSATPGLNNVAVGAYTSAHGVKPESSMALEIVSTTVKTIANWMPITKRAASDASQVRTLVDNFLRYGLNEELEDQILTGSGSGENFTGILNSSPSTVGSAGTDLDAIVDAIRTVRVTGRRRPTALVIHPNDWYSTGFLLAKDSQGNYLVGDPRASVDQLNQLWGLQVVVTEAMTENTALVGDFRQAVLWEREGVTLSMSDSHNDFFTRNLLAILAEMRAAFGVLDAEAFCTVTSV